MRRAAITIAATKVVALGVVVADTALEEPVGREAAEEGAGDTDEDRGAEPQPRGTGDQEPSNPADDQSDQQQREQPEDDGDSG